jgi:hypothetical protein
VRDARDLEQRYRELEGRKEVPLSTRVRRGQVGLLLALLLSVLLAGVTAAVDLRRLQTPLGTAQAWSEATVFGDCDRHLALSVRAPGDDDSRVPDELCQALRRRSLDARTTVPGTSVQARLLSREGSTALAEAVVRRPAGRTVARVPLRRQDDGWVVVRDDEACSIGCG